MIRVAITGVGGKMGQMILRIALEDKDVVVTGATEAGEHPFVGKTIGEITGKGTPAVPVVEDINTVVGGADVVIDFTSPSATMNHFRAVRSHGKGIVIGTTGFPPELLGEIYGANDAKVVMSPNMSVGVNILIDVIERLSKMLKDDYDVEIVEMHHRWKKDAPSGTALRLKEAVTKAQPSRQWQEIFGRQGITGERKNDEIGIMSLRGGDVVGDHTVTFAGIGERIEVTHRAHSRETFARGAVVAAKWLAAQEKGLYSMRDVLGL